MNAVVKKGVILVLLLLVLTACGRGVKNANAERPGAIVELTDSLVRADSLARLEPEEPPFSIDNIVIEKELQYDKYTLADTFPYQDTVRIFQFDKMRERLFLLDSIQLEPAQWGVIQNRQNVNGESELIKEWSRDEYKRVADKYGVERWQAAALYVPGDSVPERYGIDGSLVKVLGENSDSTRYRIESYNAPGVWLVDKKYVKLIADTVVFRKAVMVDRVNQNIATLEKSGDKWLIRSMNPATTGVHNPPYAHETPEGMFVVQEKKTKMYYLVDGTSRLAGYAPWASRFCNGGYLHGVPTNDPQGAIIEYSWTLGSVPRSHMCVRNASSHAKFMFDWAPVWESIVFVYD
jgi:hypothetical protein